ncbi:MAG: hypothetical protein WKG52_01240 [Variovorax sp.]
MAQPIHVGLNAAAAVTQQLLAIAHLLVWEIEKLPPRRGEFGPAIEDAVHSQEVQCFAERIGRYRGSVAVHPAEYAGAAPRPPMLDERA